MRYPVILVKSDGPESAENLITNIRKIPLEKDQEIVLIDKDVSAVAYKYHIVTKYYEVNVLLYPYAHKDLDMMPEILREHVEAVLIYFDASDRNFLSALDKYAAFVEDNEIELGVLLCKELFDHEKDGITYREAKQHYKLLDVIELDRKNSTDDEEEVGVEGSTSHHDPVGYDELLQALRSFLWSNVNTGAMGPDRRGSKKHSISVPNDKHDSASEAPVDEKDVEAELANFEKLLTQLITFRPNSQNWSRNERLAAAQEFAEIFEDLLDGDEAGAVDNESDLSDTDEIVDSKTGSAFGS